MLPELARRIVEAYSKPGDLIVDPMCGTGTLLVEAAALGRRCIGVDLEPQWVNLARANVRHVLPQAQRRLARARVGDARRLTALLRGVRGGVDLVATSPPYTCEAGVIDKAAWLAGGRICDSTTLNYSSDHANLGHARGDAYRAAMASVYAACFDVLRPGGLLVTVTKNMRRNGRLVDLTAVTTELAAGAGFGYLQHNIALLAAIRGDALVSRPSFWQLTQTRHGREAGLPLHLVVHEDVLVFIKGEERDRG